MKEKLQQWISQRPNFAWAAVLFVLAFLQYANTLGHGYAWDDDIVIVYNSRVQQGFAGIPSHFQFRARENFEDFSGFRPITMTSFSIDVGLFGLNPHASHWVNVLLFGLLVVVLFQTLRRIFPNYHIAFSFFIALLFLVHPVHVEVVANIKSRDEILSMLFALLALSRFVQYYDSGKWLHLVLSSVYLTMGALSKEGALTYLAVMPLTVLILLDGDWKRKFKALLYYPAVVLGLVLIFFVMTGKPPGTPSPVKTKGYLESQTLGNCLATNDLEQGNWQRFGNSGYLFALNLKKFIYPVDLVYFSGYNAHPVLSWNADRLLLGILFTLHNLFLIGICIFYRRIKPFFYSYWYYFFTISVYLQLPGFLLADTIADRFLFLPSLGLCISAVYVLARILGWDMLPIASSSKQSPSVWQLSPRLKLFAGLFIAICLVLSGMTFTRNRVWKDNLHLFSHDLPLLDDCARAHYYYASELTKGFAQAKNPAQTKAEIVKHYQRAIAITPQSYYAYIRLAKFHIQQKEYREAVKLMEQAVPNYRGQGEVWAIKGLANYHSAQYTEATADLLQARLLNPEINENWEYLARSYARDGLYNDALMVLDEAIGRDPGYPFYYDALSDTYFEMKDTAQVFPPIQKLLEMEPDNPVWWRKIIGRYQMMGDDKAANYYYQQAMQRGLAL